MLEENTVKSTELAILVTSLFVMAVSCAGCKTSQSEDGAWSLDASSSSSPSEKDVNGEDASAEENGVRGKIFAYLFTRLDGRVREYSFKTKIPGTDKCYSLTMLDGRELPEEGLENARGKIPQGIKSMDWTLPERFVLKGASKAPSGCYSESPNDGFLIDSLEGEIELVREQDGMPTFSIDISSVPVMIHVDDPPTVTMVADEITPKREEKSSD